MFKSTTGLLFAAAFLATCTISQAGNTVPVPKPSPITVTQKSPVRFDQLPGYTKAQTQVANRIAARFAKAGYGRPQQIAAVSVAIRESTLNPKAHNRGCNCFGLFQMNRSRGLGTGHSISNLTTTDYNISLIIKEAKRFNSFAAAKNVNEAIKAFVRNVTRPGNKARVVNATVKTAKKVQKSANQRRVASIID
ncbi:MAG: hypothetical protein P1V21_18785 [Rhizobiaceae bacterium]|nr:hypothetical protein [Rhizobiaceae bacterium]